MVYGLQETTSNAWDLPGRVTIARHGADHPSFKHGTYGFGDLGFGALFWTRRVSFGSETVQWIVHFEPFSNDSWSVNHQPNMVIHTKNVVVSQKNCSPIDEQ